MTSCDARTFHSAKHASAIRDGPDLRSINKRHVHCHHEECGGVVRVTFCFWTCVDFAGPTGRARHGACVQANGGSRLARRSRVVSPLLCRFLDPLAPVAGLGVTFPGGQVHGLRVRMFCAQFWGCPALNVLLQRLGSIKFGSQSAWSVFTATQHAAPAATSIDKAAGVASWRTLCGCRCCGHFRHLAASLTPAPFFFVVGPRHAKMPDDFSKRAASSLATRGNVSIGSREDATGTVDGNDVEWTVRGDKPAAAASAPAALVPPAAPPPPAALGPPAALVPLASRPSGTAARDRTRAWRARPRRGSGRAAGRLISSRARSAVGPRVGPNRARRGRRDLERVEETTRSCHDHSIKDNQRPSQRVSCSLRAHLERETQNTCWLSHAGQPTHHLPCPVR